MFYIKPANSVEENLVELLNTRAKRRVETGEFTFGTPQAITPDLSNGEKNTQLELTYVGEESLGGQTIVYYDRVDLGVYNGHHNLEDAQIEDGQTLGDVLSLVCNVVGLVRSQITSQSTLPSAGNTGVVEITPIADSVLYRGSFSFEVQNMTAALPSPTFHLSSRGAAAGTGAVFRSTKTNEILTKIGTVGSETDYSLNNDYSLYTNNTGSALRIPHTEVAGVLEADFTIELFLAVPTRDATTRMILGQWTTAAGTGQRLFIGMNSTSFNVAISDGVEYTSVNTPVASFALATWYHVAIVVNGNTLTVYLNGVSVGSATIAINRPADHVQDWLLGGQWTTASHDGGIRNESGDLRVDELAIYNYAKYTANFTVPEFLWDLPHGDSVRLSMEGAEPANEVTGTPLVLGGSAAFSTAEKTNGSQSLRLTDSGFGYATLPISESGHMKSGDFSIAFSVRPVTTIATTKHLLGIWQAVSQTITNCAWQVILAGSAIRFFFAPLRFSSAVIVVAGSVPTGAWSRCKIIRKGNNFTTYLNGVRQNSTSGTWENNAAMTVPNFLIGQQYGNAGVLPSNVQTPDVYMDAIRMRQGVETTVEAPV